jgi:two-component system chemotaxis response regulator CheY
VDALKKLNGKKIQLFVIDINMPNMDGITFMTGVKKMDNFKYTPFIMLTTEAGEAKKQAAKEAGAKAWVQKPFQVATLLAAIAKFVGN